MLDFCLFYGPRTFDLFVSTNDPMIRYVVEVA
jgi:hypothetical protein